MGPQLDIRSPGSFADTLQSDPEAWALRINAAWRRSLEAVIETGRLLIDAKSRLKHGQWQAMIETQLDFSADTAQRLMAIARDERLTNPAHARFLPRSYTTLAELTKLSDGEFGRGIAEKIIRPDMERKDVEIIRPALQRASPDAGYGRADEAMARDAGVASGSQKGAAAPAKDEDHGSADETGMGSERPSPSEADQSHMPGGGLAIAHSRVEPADSLDFFPTPPWATRALIEHVFDHLGRRGHCGWQVCWEPACGEGHMAEPLKEYFREVVASDVKDYGYGDHTVDFLSCEQLARKYDADWIITNPPFGENTDKFILKALELAGTGVAMLVRLQCLETVGRYEKIFSKTPPTKIAFFVERVPMHKGRWEPDGDTMTAYIWLVWIKGAQPQAPFWIPPGCREALTKPDDAARFGAPPAEAA